MPIACPPPQSQHPPLPSRSWFRHHFMAFSLMGFTVFLFLVATNTQSGWVYVIVACILAALVTNFFLTRSSIRLSVERRFNGNVSAGSTASVTVILTNASAHPKYGVTVCEYLPSTLPDIAPVRHFYVDYVPAHGQASFSYDILCLMRGYHRFTKITLASSFPLNIFWMRRTLKVPAELIVSPRCLEINIERQGQESAQESEQSRLHRGQSDDFYGLREYVVGDDLRHVSWAASARAGELMMREYQDISVQSKIVIAIDPTRTLPLQTAAQEDLEAALSLAASLVRWCLGSKRVPQLITVADGIIKMSQPDKTDSFMAAIQSESDPAGSQALYNWIYNENNATDCQIIYIRITGSEQNESPASAFGQNNVFTVVCGPALTPPTLCFFTIAKKNKTVRRYLPINDIKVPEDLRLKAQNWQPLISCNHYGANQAYQCGANQLEQTLEWLIERIQR